MREELVILNRIDQVGLRNVFSAIDGFHRITRLSEVLRVYKRLSALKLIMQSLNQRFILCIFYSIKQQS
ncbi:hypothetical protein KIN20_000158 [Parelaphostrongylus tenuis]|uniref:Uncharacterized protein n=1 Tax=Parelaphostrongylus tenuis TaxID=148309 RepID=A0AAD5LVP7_PARTN|nr:hypothetical protein KIN20_000158 [Parelaphostrongylus tenuis]